MMGDLCLDLLMNHHVEFHTELYNDGCHHYNRQRCRTCNVYVWTRLTVVDQMCSPQILQKGIKQERNRNRQQNYTIQLIDNTLILRIRYNCHASSSQ
mmetsp:Transcript_16662/g.39889  ORF Transcript_16662/g.39889 Transcript_16662/m.39889 type:complete len:97 (+) Transcript_16662:250-540(+)